MKMQENTMTDRMMKSDSSAARAAKPARAFRVLTVLAAALFATAALSCTADSENTRGDVVRISVSGAASAAECVQEALEHASLIVSYENGSEERIPLKPLPEGVSLSVGGTAVDFDRSFLQDDGETVRLAVSYAGKTDTLSVRNSAYQKPEPSDPEAPETPEYVTDVSLSFAQEAYTEEQENILKELRVSVTFDGDGYSAHTKTLTLHKLYDWLSDFYTYAGEYYRFSLYAGSGAEDGPLFSFPSGNGFPEDKRIPLTAEESSFRWTLSLFAEPQKDYGGTVSVTVQAGTYTLQLSDLESLAVPGAPDTPLTLTAQTIKQVGDISSGTVTVHYKKVFGEDGTEAAEATNQNKEAAVAEAVAEMKKKHGAIDSRLLDGTVSITKSTDKYNMPVRLYDNNKLEIDQYKIKTDAVISLDGNFDYSEMKIEVVNNNNIKRELTKDQIGNATFSLTGYNLKNAKDFIKIYKDLPIKTTFDKDIMLKTSADEVKDYATPTLNFNMDSLYTEDVESQNYIVYLHKLYDLNNLNKINVTQTYTDSFNTFDSQLPLFTENKLKTEYPNLSIDALVKLNKNIGYKGFKNISVKGNYDTSKENYDINTQFTNVVFEGDVSGLTNSEVDQFYGVAYFKNKNYTIKAQPGKHVSAAGILRLDDLSNTENIEISSPINDFRGTNKDEFLNYNSSYDYTNSDTQINNKNFIYDNIIAMYFDDYIKENEAIKIAHRFNVLKAGIGNVFSDTTKVFSSNSKAHSRTPRSLEEFEYYGNNGRFEKSAKSSYDGYEKEFEALQEAEKEKLNNDTNNQIALNNRRVSASIYA